MSLLQAACLLTSSPGLSRRGSRVRAPSTPPIKSTGCSSDVATRFSLPASRGKPVFGCWRTDADSGARSSVILMPRQRPCSRQRLNEIVATCRSLRIRTCAQLPLGSRRSPQGRAPCSRPFLHVLALKVPTVYCPLDLNALFSVQSTQERWTTGGVGYSRVGFRSPSQHLKE